jgi:hypothetical protein
MLAQKTKTEIFPFAVGCGDALSQATECSARLTNTHGKEYLPKCIKYLASFFLNYILFPLITLPHFRRRNGIPFQNACGLEIPFTTGNQEVIGCADGL